jgi:hypothetical protein
MRALLEKRRPLLCCRPHLCAGSVSALDCAHIVRGKTASAKVIHTNYPLEIAPASLRGSKLVPGPKLAPPWARLLETLD